MSKVKVAMCWDDGVYTDVKIAEIFKVHKAKATFNLCPGFLPETSALPQWNLSHKDYGHNGFSAGRVGKDILYDVYKDFQVASHCWNHEVAGEVKHEVFLDAAMHARTWLEDLFQRPCTGFAYPCGGVTPEAIRDLKANGFTYARSTENVLDLRDNKEPLSLAANCHFLNRTFYARYEAAKKGCGLFYFWGHSYEMMDYDRLYAQLNEKIKYISNDPDAEWVNVTDIANALSN